MYGSVRQRHDGRACKLLGLLAWNFLGEGEGYAKRGL